MSAWCIVMSNNVGAWHSVKEGSNGCVSQYGSGHERGQVGCIVGCVVVVGTLC